MLKSLVVVGLILAGVQAQSGQKEIKGSNTTQAPKTDQRGTETSPLVVNEHTIRSDKEAAEEAQNNAKQDHLNSINIALATVIAICAALQFLGILGQGQSLHSANKSA